MLNRPKTYVLAILIIISIFQMIELWFDDYSSRNFFYSLATNFFSKNSVEVEYNYKLDPISVVVSFGNKQYTVLKNEDDAKIKMDNELNSIFNEITTNNVYVTEENISMKELLDNEAIMYEYPVRLNNIASINRDYYESNKNIKQIGEFNKLIIKLSSSDFENITCFFVDDQSNIAKKVKLKHNTKDLSDMINSIQYETSSKEYETTEYNPVKKYFSGINFLPVFTEAPHRISFTARNPFITNGETDDKNVEKYIDSFFENPSAKWNFKKQSGITMYADGEKTVKFYDIGCVEYINAKSSDKDAYVSFDDAYQIAKAFMEKDKEYMYQNLYIIDAKNSGNNEWTLYFEFNLDDYRYVMSDIFARDIGMRYPVEVIVKNNHVYSYKRLIRDFAPTSSFEYMNIITYNEVLDNLLNNVELNEDFEIKEMFLSYYSQDYVNDPKLTWVIETADKIYTIDAIKQ